MFDWWLGSRKLVLKLSRRDFDTLALLVSWHLWKECNDHTFRRCYSTLFNKVELILEEVEELILASFSRFCFPMSIVFELCAECCLSLFGRKVFV